MSQAQPDLLEKAKQGDSKAIEALINRQLQPKGITAKASTLNKTLTVIIEAKSLPAKDAVFNFIKTGISKLQPNNISKVIIHARTSGESSSIWRESFDLANQELSLRPNTNIKKNWSIKSGKFHSELLPFVTEFIKNRNGERVVIAVCTFILTSFFWTTLGSFNSNRNKTANDQSIPTVSSHKTDSFSIKGDLTLVDSNIGGTPENCFGLGGYSDIEEAMPVTIKDGQGKILATGRTGSGTQPKDVGYSYVKCIFYFQVDSVPKSDFYTIEVGRRGGLNYSFEEIQNQNWKVSLSLGS